MTVRKEGNMQAKIEPLLNSSAIAIILSVYTVYKYVYGL